MKYLALLLLYPPVAFAAPVLPTIPVTLIVTKSAESIGYRQAEKFFAEAVSRMASPKALGLRLYRTRTVEIPESYPITSTDSGERQKALNSYVRDYCRELGVSGGLMLFVTGPIIVGPTRYIAGQANGIGNIGEKCATALVNLKCENNCDARTSAMSVTAMMHETGHGLGAYHDQLVSGRVMDPDAARFASAALQPLRWSPMSIAQVRQRVAKVLGERR